MGNQQSEVRSKILRSIPLGFVEPNFVDEEETNSKDIEKVISFVGNFEYYKAKSRVFSIQKCESELEKRPIQVQRQLWPFSLEQIYDFLELPVIHLLKKDSFSGQDKSTLEMNIDMITSTLKTKRIERFGNKREKAYEILEMEKNELDNENVDLSNKRLYILSPYISSMSKIRTLDLSSNRLTDLPKELSNLMNIHTLILSDNRLAQIPECIFGLKKLKALHLDRNLLTKLPDLIGSLNRLEILDISSNKIAVIPRSMGELKNLSNFEADNNLIQYLPSEMSLLANIRTLHLNFNPLVSKEKIDSCLLQTSSTQDKNNTLLEISARKLSSSRIVPDQIPTQKLNVLFRKKEYCTFCSGSLFEQKYCRIRILKRSNQEIPFLYVMCSAHWTTEKQRTQQLFSSSFSKIQLMPLKMDNRVNPNNKDHKNLRLKTNQRRQLHRVYSISNMNGNNEIIVDEEWYKVPTTLLG